MVLNKPIILFLCLVGFILIPSIGFSASLESYLQQLPDSHHLIGAVRNKTEASRHKTRSEMARYYPSVRFSSSVGYEKINDEVDEDTELFRSYNSLKATQLLYDFGVTSGAVEIARLDEMLTEIELLETTQSVTFNAIKAYLNVVRQIQRSIYSASTENNFRKQVDAETKMEQKGAGRASDVLQVKAQLSGAIANRIRIEGDLRLAKNEFETIFQQPLSDEEAVLFSLPDPPFADLPGNIEEALIRAYTYNNKLLIEQYRTKKGKSFVDKVKATLWPKIDLALESKYKHNDQGTEGDRFENFVGMELKYSLFSGGRDVANIKAAQARQAFFSRRQEHARLQVKELVRQEWQKLQTLKQTSKVYKEQAIQSADFLLLARKERRFGTRSVIDVLNAENVYFLALNNAIVSQADYVLSVYSLLHSMGTLDIKPLAVQ